MPQPTASQVHIDVALTNISVAWLQNAADYVAPRVFPIVPVVKQSNKYFIYRQGDFFRDEATLRAPGTESSGGGYNLDTGSYFCDVWSHHKMVDPQVRANADNPLDMDRDAAIWVSQILAIRREVQFLSKYFTTGVWTGSTTGTDITPGTLWDAAGSLPIENIEAQQFHIKELTGKWPNRLVLGANVYRALKNHDEFLQRFKYTQAGSVITPQLMASVLSPPAQVEASDSGPFEVLVASAIQNTGHEGADDAFSFIADKTDALLCFAEPNPGVMRPSAGYTFVWTPIGGYEARIRQIPMPWLGLDENGNPAMRVEGEITMDAKVVSSLLGAYFNGATS